MKTLSFEARDLNCNNFCPLCGTHNFGEEGLNECKHLLFVYLNLADGIEYIREDVAEMIEGVDDFNIVETLCDLDIKNGFIFEENDPGPSQSFFMIGYEYLDDE